MHLLNRITHKLPLLNLIPFFLFLVIICTTLLSVVSSLSGFLFLEIFSHFKVQYLIVNLFIFCILLIGRKKIFIIISLFCLAILLTELVPWYIPQADNRGNTPANLRILSWNVNLQNQNYSEVLSLVRQEQPDIAVIIETTEEWLKELKSLNDIFPYSIADGNRYNFFGIAVYSKLPLNNASINFFGYPKNPTIVANLAIKGQVISLIATHPPPPRPSSFHDRNKQLNEMSKYVKTLSNPVVIVGDLNMTMWSYFYKKFVTNTGLKNASQGFGILPTWPKKTTYTYSRRIPPVFFKFLSIPFLSIPIDHCLISPEIKVANIRTGPTINSDHLPLVIDLVIPEKKG